MGWKILRGSGSFEFFWNSPFAVFIALFTREKESEKKIHIHSNIENQSIYINDICISKNKKIDLYHFVKKIDECYSNDYINQIVKNSVKQSVSYLLFGVYAQRSMKITAYIDEYNYIEYYISNLKTC